MCFSRSSVSMLSSADLRSAPGGFSATSGGFPAQEEPSAEIMATIHTVFLIIVSPENSRHLFIINLRVLRALSAFAVETESELTAKTRRARQEFPLVAAEGRLRGLRGETVRL